MKKLSEFLEIEENVEFELTKYPGKFLIMNNCLYYYNYGTNTWSLSKMPINSIIDSKIKILPKQILTENEKEYLINLIRPFKDIVNFIFCDHNYLYVNAKINIYDEVDEHTCNLEYIQIYRSKDMPFKALKQNKKYTLKELCLFL